MIKVDCTLLEGSGKLKVKVASQDKVHVQKYKFGGTPLEPYFSLILGLEIAELASIEVMILYKFKCKEI